MRNAWGKPQGTCARVQIGQVIMSVRVADKNRDDCVEAFRRTGFRFPGFVFLFFVFCFFLHVYGLIGKDYKK